MFPTDTVYGFLADATNRKAVEKIYKIKKRPKAKPLPIFVKSLSMAKELAEINDKQAKILRKFWPGRYTFVIKRKLSKARPRPGEVGPWKVFGVDKKTIALRIPKNAFLQKLLKKINRPLVQTSVNISSQEPLKNIEAIIEAFGKNRLAGLVIDGGNLKKAVSSRVYNITKGLLTRIR